MVTIVGVKMKWASFKIEFTTVITVSNFTNLESSILKLILIVFYFALSWTADTIYWEMCYGDH